MITKQINKEYSTITYIMDDFLGDWKQNFLEFWYIKKSLDSLSEASISLIKRWTSRKRSYMKTNWLCLKFQAQKKELKNVIKSDDSFPYQWQWPRTSRCPLPNPGATPRSPTQRSASTYWFFFHPCWWTGSKLNSEKKIQSVLKSTFFAEKIFLIEELCMNKNIFVEFVDSL